MININKLYIIVIFIMMIIFCPSISSSKTYTLDDLFNQKEMLNLIDIDIKMYLSENRNIDVVCQAGDTSFRNLIDFIKDGKNINPVEAFRFYLAANFVVLSYFAKNALEVPANMLQDHNKRTTTLFMLLKEKGVISGSVNEFTYLYNETLLTLSPIIMKRL